MPQFAEDSLEDLLEMLKSQGIVGIRKMFQGPKRAESSLYILIFLGRTWPDKIKVGYTSAQVDKYYPSPLRCGKCCWWGHSIQNCHSGSLCSNCRNKGHNKNECKAELPKCVNCKGTHDATLKNCPRYLSEREISQIKVDQKISFKEAWIKVSDGQSADGSTVRNSQDTMYSGDRNLSDITINRF